MVPDVILNYLYDVYERNIDIQCRFKWTAGASGKYMFAVLRELLMLEPSTLGQPHHATHCQLGL